MSNRYLASNQRPPIKPTLPHAERVRLGLTPADPNYMPPKIYNPDASISAAQRSKNAKAAGARAGEHADAVRKFSPWELEELRMDLLTLRSERADRFVTLIDQVEAAAGFQDAVSGALDAAELEGLADAVNEAKDELERETDTGKAVKGGNSNADDKVAEILADNPKATFEEIAALFVEFHDKKLSEIRKEITETFEKLAKAVEQTREALAPIDPNA